LEYFQKQQTPLVRLGEVEIEDICIQNFEIEVGEMQYGFPIEGILGFDFMQATGIVIDSKRLEIYHNEFHGDSVDIHLLGVLVMVSSRRLLL
jgi:hypothetical protein